MGLSAAGLLPGIGNAATTAKTARKGVKAVVNGAEAWKRIRPAVNAGSVLFGENGAVVPSYGVGSIIRKGADLISDVVRKGSDAIRSASKTADAASSATKTVTPDSISWYNPKTSPRPGTFADEIDNAKDAVYATGSTTVKNPMVTRNPGSGQMVAHNPSSNLPATVEDVATGTKTGN